MRVSSRTRHRSVATIIGAAVCTVAALLGLAGCGPAGPTSVTSSAAPVPTVTLSSSATGPGPASSPAPQPGSIGTVTVTRTGGIAGVEHQLVISADGSWVFTDRGTGAVKRGQLTTAQRGEVVELLQSPALAAEARTGGSAAGCNDTFVYSIVVGERSLQYDQCTAGQRPTTRQLIAALTAATPL
jgi:hypothetical protein